MFGDLGMEAFAERAARELDATSETVRKRLTEARDDLSARERQIAQLARHGLSNPEIGARLFLAPRTLELHLRKVFTKLGILARRDLAQAARPHPSADDDRASVLLAGGQRQIAVGPRAPAGQTAPRRCHAP
jgi:DNA-binding NarL/FixJ family response regulator